MYSSYVAPGIIPTVSTYGYGVPMATTVVGGLPCSSVYCSTPIATYPTYSTFGAPVMMNAPIGVSYGGVMGVPPVSTTEVITTEVVETPWLW